MTQIVLTSEQVAQLTDAEAPFVLVNPEGRSVGHVEYAPSCFTPDELAEASARIGKEGLGITTAELLARLEKLKQP